MAPTSRPHRSSPARLPCAALALVLLGGCGVAGRPLPPGPAPAAAPAVGSPINTPDGVLLTLAAPLRDLDGAPLPADEPAVELWAYAAASPEGCAGPPVARGPVAGVQLPPSTQGPLRLVVVRGGRVGEPSEAISVSWQPPPPPPEAPLAFVDADGAVQLSWLPPEPPLVELEIRRDDRPVARAPAADAMWSERPGPGRHHYTLVAIGPGQRTGPSAAATVEVPPSAP